jgi:hypothetical protein
MRLLRIAAWLMLLIAIGAAAQTPRDRKMIAYAKAIPVSQLDPKLPATPFERWLIKEAGEGAQVTWEINDCGEQTGTAEDAERDFPMCVEADAHLRDKRVIVVSIAVGTYQKGISGKPVTWWISVGRDPDSDEPLETLSDVPAGLAETSDMPPTVRNPPGTEVKKK